MLCNMTLVHGSINYGNPSEYTLIPGSCTGDNDDRGSVDNGAMKVEEDPENCQPLAATEVLLTMIVITVIRE